ncbi:hypothetical protein KIN20_021393 [Parelaphostrongylus tenuis]|uniref:Uncharacterized protein n=1 Tax=Parelaphostrongylus tenuis TaxID=148309 RepID=A0AAD5N567_PARTN|nr:hypothetical protein KIN20_021393 [Parelaphostrongylus tenuis]
MTQPDLEFTINGVKYNVSATQYVIDIEIEDGTVSAMLSSQRFCVHAICIKSMHV